MSGSSRPHQGARLNLPKVHSPSASTWLLSMRLGSWPGGAMRLFALIEAYDRVYNWDCMCEEHVVISLATPRDEILYD